MSDRVAGYYLDAAITYCTSVLSGKITANKWVKAACRRQLDDLEAAERDPTFPFEWRPDKAEHICRFLEMLPHIKGKWAGRRIVLDLWQILIVTTVFGWYRKNGGCRRFRTVYIEVARKNAKSTLSSGVALYMLTADSEPGAEIYSAATTRDQARIVFDDARKMASMESGFRQRYGVRVLAHSIYEVINGGKFSPLSAEGSTLDGLNIHFAVVDELHAHKTRAVYDVLETATGAREQSLIWNITTAGSDRSGICYEQRNYVTGILNTVLHRHDGLGYPIKGSRGEDDTYFGIIYTIDDADDWADESCWAKANPNYGVSVYADDMRRLADKAIKTASARPNFLTKRLNVWVNASSAWMDMRRWDDCADESLTPEQFADCKCVIALDLASKKDIADKVLIFERNENGLDHYYAFASHYLPEDAAQEEANSQYAGWAEDGWLTTTPGNVIDFDQIENDLAQDLIAYQVAEIPFDPWQATQLANNMAKKNAPMVEFRQTVQNMSEPMKHFEALVLSRRFHHSGDPVLTWMVSNVVAHLDAKDNIYPRKDSEEKKIDGAVAVIMGLARLINPAEESVEVIGSDYELMVV